MNSADFSLARSCVRLANRYADLLAKHSVLRANCDDRRNALAGQLFETRQKLVAATREMNRREERDSHD